MIKDGPIGRSTFAAALLALALLSLASVRSVVMQAVAAAQPAAAQSQAQAPCPDMAGMAGMDRPAKPSAPAGATKACVYCAAAAHLPLCAQAPLVQPARAVAWAAFSPMAATGPSAGVAITPRARGPPATALDA